ncbi:class I SAM-dependent methyltransferase [Desulfofustis glycolicus]|uniref:Methyltransferase domain-containing protein n=1 Tax=Desulfofustis glycolicus DSM 9705 TaxID=1121409 RepID=A0A1M5X2H7_9BACT|nr:class I SAM-dependent methyltransferase [Desulfofustis glycolicus]MCB2218705.1 class I SAM-dependent methyltransferase [Desulfobulbaceae bacterium]SHH93423.1 Methyltransferase domain-containing protein [Desulfofustis glycolicus DSM 9705]
MLTELSAWTTAWREAIQEMHQVSDTTYWDRRAPDYNDFILTSEYSYGEAITTVLAANGCLSATDHVLEIAAGVGAVTIPLARRSAHVTAFEPAPTMADFLGANISAFGLTNIEIRRESFDSNTDCAPKSCDLILLCHAAWHFPDFIELVKSMEKISRGYCCLADTSGLADPDTEIIHRQLNLPLTAGIDRVPYLFNQLYFSNRRPQLTHIPWTTRRSVASALAMWTMVLEKYRRPEETDLAIIRDHVLARSKNGIYESPSLMALLWWPSA